MLFNSYVFIFAFLPITVAGFILLGRFKKNDLVILWLVLASLFFYGWWNPYFLFLILFSLFFNYIAGLLLSRKHSKEQGRRALFYICVLINLFVLGYYKYANFFLDNLNAIAETNYHLYNLILPLGISFFTFQQIAFLIDAHNGETREYNFINYSLFVTFFPQLIAGPIVHHKEMIRQFRKYRVLRFDKHRMSIGLSIFFIGLFKKVIIADGLLHQVAQVYDTAGYGGQMGVLDAWRGAFSYTIQVYFDFSAYSDMALGLGRMFGIVLPLNFHSPVKAVSIVDFWRRWHMTLSRFLFDYLYLPLGGNRKGLFSHFKNLMLTMVIGGFWHGANWTFVIWGALNGIFLIINHGWRIFRRKHGLKAGSCKIFCVASSWVITFLAIAVTRVYFRAKSLHEANNLLGEMFAFLGRDEFVWSSGNFPATEQWAKLGLALLIALSLPNTFQLFSRYKPALDTYRGRPESLYNAKFHWHPTRFWAIVLAAMGLVAIGNIQSINTFIYFQF